MFKAEICKFYNTKYGCKHGINCKFLHADFSPPVSSSLLSSRPSHNKDDATVKNLETSAQKTEEINTSNTQNNAAAYVIPIVPSSKQKNACKWFKSKRGCRYGSECKFHHDISHTLHKSHYNDDKSTAIINDNVKTDIKYKEGPEFSIKETATITAARKDKNQDCKTHVESSDSDKKGNANVKGKICKFYLAKRWCRYGRFCVNRHVRELRNYNDSDARKNVQENTVLHAASTPRQQPSRNVTTAEDVPLFGDVATVTDIEESRRHRQKKKVAVCRFYKSGHCRLGKRCHFDHPDSKIKKIDKENDTERDSAAEETPVKNVHQSVKSLYRPQMKRAEATPEILGKERSIEIAQLKKRFTNESLVIVQETEELSQYRIQFSPSDPDWPYDVRKFVLLISFPKNYPLELFTLGLPADQSMPETVRRFVELSIEKWLKSKSQNLEKTGVLQLVFRPFLRWLDKGLEEIVTNGLALFKRELVAQAAGIGFIPAHQLLGAKTPDPVQNNEDEQSGSDADSQSEDDEDKTIDPSLHDESQTREQSKIDLNPEKKGTEIVLRNLQLRENAATILFSKIEVIVQCNRCKQKTEIKVPAQEVNSVPCSKCNSELLIQFRPSMLHQFSSVMGYLDLIGCSAFDLVLQNSTFHIGCMNCSKEMKVEGLSLGHPWDSWCQSCHQKLRIAAESVRFQQLQTASVDIDGQNVHQVTVAKQKKVPKDPAIKEGSPLPGFGACKHYKKSFRWLRFPCCGKAYPCDICHDSEETDHDMKFANRMICGHCCREQPYAKEKPCVSCNSALTKGASSYWEGGRGCRDRTRMSKNDSQKYANLNKTTSRRSQKIST